SCVLPALTQTVLFFLTYQKITTSVDNVQLGNNVSIYPNPASDKVRIESPESELVAVSVWDLNATERITLNNMNGKTNEINVSTLESGIYIIALKNVNGEVA